MMAMRDAAAVAPVRLTPRRVQEVLDESITFAIECGREHALSEVFIERLCLAVGAAWIRVCESAENEVCGADSRGFRCCGRVRAR